VAGAEPAVVVASASDGHAAQVRAHANHHQVLQYRATREEAGGGAPKRPVI
jgi:hypothetical protein